MQCHSPSVSIPYLPLNFDMLPTGKFTIHTHPSLHDTTLLCTPDGRAVTTLNGPRVRHLFQLFRPDLSQHTFEEEVYLLNHANTVSVKDNLRKRSYSHSPANGTVTATTCLQAWCRDNKSVKAVA